MHPLFGTKHLILIGVCLCAIVALFFYARERKFKDVCRVCFYCGIISEIIKIFYYIVQNEETHGGVLPKTDLPFHLCSIQILFFAFLYVSQNEKLKRFLISFMLPSCLFGGIAAILIATDSSRNGLWIITFQYFAYHVMLVVFSLYLFSSKELKFTAKDYVNCLKFLLILMFVAVYVNSIVDDGSGKINFMYVVSPPQSGLPFLNENHGWLVYIAHYACLVLFCVTTCYLKPIIEFFKTLKNKDAQPLPEQTSPVKATESEKLEEVATTTDERDCGTAQKTQKEDV